MEGANVKTLTKFGGGRKHEGSPLYLMGIQTIIEALRAIMEALPYVGVKAKYRGRHIMEEAPLKREGRMLIWRRLPYNEGAIIWRALATKWKSATYQMEALS